MMPHHNMPWPPPCRLPLTLLVPGMLAMTAGSPDKVLALYAANAVLLPTVENGPKDTPAKIKA